MAARSMWNGNLHVGRVTLPVKLLAAVEDRAVRFHLLHKKDGHRVKQRLVHSETGDEVAHDQIRKGFEIEPGVFVMLDESDLAGLEPQPSREIEITRFVPFTPANFPWYERPYYLAPDNSGDDYFALAAALERSGREGVARWVMRKRHYAGALRAEGGYLMLVAMRHEGEVVHASALPAPDGPALTAKEVAMAEQLVTMLEEEFDPAAFRDEYRERLMDLIEAKTRGKVYRFEQPAVKRRTEDLSRALAASLTQARKERASA